MWSQNLGRRRSVVRAIAGSLAGGAAAQAFLVLSGILVARALGVTGRGHLALLTLIPVALAQLGSLGVPIALTYFVSRDPSRARAIIQAIVPLAIIQVVLLVPAHALILALMLPGQPRAVVVAGLVTLPAIPILLSSQYALALLQGQQDFRRFTFLLFMPAATYSLAVVATVLFSRAELVEITAAWVASYAIAALITVSAALRQLPPTAGVDSSAPIGRLVRFGLSGLVGSASPIERFRVDQTLVGVLLTPAALGLYVVAASFTTIMAFIASGFAAIGFPRVAAGITYRARRQALWRYFLAASVIVVAVFIPLQATAGWIVPLFFGEEFRNAVPITRILLLAGLLFAARRVLAELARGAGHPIHGTLAELAAIVALVATAMIFIPVSGLYGMAWSMVISSLAGLVVVVTLLGSGRSGEPVHVGDGLQAAPNP